MNSCVQQDGWSSSTGQGTRTTNTMFGHHCSQWTEKDRSESQITHCKRDQERYLRGELLGSGGWSKVYKVRRVCDGAIFAGKWCRTLHLIRKEAQTLKSIEHDHFLKFVDWDEEPRAGPDDVLLITELCVGGTLQQRIDDNSRVLPGCEALELLAQMASALEYLHASGRFHSDVKPRNILIRSLDPLHAVLGDCADIQHVGTISRSRPRGTPAYFSPEILHFNRSCGQGDDMWALGVTMLGMVGQWPQMKYTKDGAKLYPKECHYHVVSLQDLNPGDGLVEGLLVPLLAWDVKHRMQARECRSKTLELQNSRRWGCEKIKLQMPEDFKPISFW